MVSLSPAQQRRWWPAPARDPARWPCILVQGDSYGTGIRRAPYVWWLVVPARTQDDAPDTDTPEPLATDATK